MESIKKTTGQDEDKATSGNKNGNSFEINDSSAEQKKDKGASGNKTGNSFEINDSSAGDK